MRQPTTLKEVSSLPPRYEESLNFESGYWSLQLDQEALLKPMWLRLRYLHDLHDGWDGESGKAITATAFTTASRIAVEGSLSFGVLPAIMPMLDGGMLVEWENGLRALQIAVHESGQAVYGAVVDDDLISEGQLTFPVSQLRELLRPSSAYA